MVKYSLKDELFCWNCNETQVPFASLNEDISTWHYEKCGEFNFVLIDTLNFKIGHQLLSAAEDLLRDEEYDLASVLLYSAVDASLCRGIIELQNWRSIEKLESPPESEKIESDLSRINMGQKIKRFEKLAGATLDEEILCLRSKVSKEDFERISFDLLKNNFERLQKERHKLIHYGKNVDPEIIKSGVAWVSLIIYILDSMWNAAFKERRT